MRTASLLLLSSFVLAASPKPRTADAVADELVALIKKQNRNVMVDVIGGETSWTDAAILERNKSFPRSIAALIKSPSPDRKMEPGKVAGLIDAYEQHRDGYVEATIERAGPECFVVAGANRSLVNCVYLDYLQARYPKASPFIHGEFDPMLLVDQQHVRALLMPMRR